VRKKERGNTQSENAPEQSRLKAVGEEGTTSKEFRVGAISVCFRVSGEKYRAYRGERETGARAATLSVGGVKRQARFKPTARGNGFLGGGNTGCRSGRPFVGEANRNKEKKKMRGRGKGRCLFGRRQWQSPCVGGHAIAQ